MVTNCGDCAFWLRDRIGSEFGECRRHAPRTSMWLSGDPPATAYRMPWPTVRGDESCGEGSPRVADLNPGPLIRMQPAKPPACPAGNDHDAIDARLDRAAESEGDSIALKMRSRMACNCPLVLRNRPVVE